MNTVQVTPALVAWARTRSRLPLEVLARRTGTKAAQITAWEQGAAQPTFKQATKLADVTHVPLGYLFLSTPPAESSPIADLRTVRDADPLQDHPDFLDVVRDVQFKMDWYREYRLERGDEPLPFVGKFKDQRSVAAVVRDMRAVLGVGQMDRQTITTFEAYLRFLCERAEACGIWVMRSGVVKGNNARPLEVDLFRGFAISDPLVPLVFINARDAQAAQVFTLVHELAHLWVGVTGVSNPWAESFRGGGRDNVEAFCNAVAAEFLVPRDAFVKAWDDRATLRENASRLKAEFRVSAVVIAVRARTLALVSEADFAAFLTAERRAWAQKREDSSGGGDYYRTARVRNGSAFFDVVIASAHAGRVLFRDAGRLLAISPKSVNEAHRRRAGEGG